MYRMLLIVLMSFVMLVGCGTGETESGETSEVSENNGEPTENNGEETVSGEEFVLQLGHNAPENSGVGLGASTLKELVEEKTDGRVVIEIFPNAELGDEVSMVQNMGAGINDMVVTGDGIFGTFWPEFEGLLLPFLIEDSNHMDQVYQGEIGQEMS